MTERVESQHATNTAQEIPQAPEGPNLGLATTRQLLEELSARIEIDYFQGGGGLDYSTVLGRKATLTSEATLTSNDLQEPVAYILKHNRMTDSLYFGLFASPEKANTWAREHKTDGVLIPLYLNVDWNR